VAGLKQERGNPREIEGKQALFVVNLPTPWSDNLSASKSAQCH
jgi:hypothetical protein